jgi:hypothetical protein
MNSKNETKKNALKILGIPKPAKEKSDEKAR